MMLWQLLHSFIEYAPARHYTSGMSMPLDELQKVRLQKLTEIKKLGINPYPSISRRDQITSQAILMLGKKVFVAGRLMAIRGHGGIRFADLHDESGKIQLVFKKDLLCNSETLQLLELLDIGDFIEASGEVFKTNAGEVSVQVKSFGILSKSLRPLPSAWYGLKDVEERYRKRYLDLILNPAVKQRLDARGKITSAIREFLNSRGFVETETPTLQPMYGGGLAKPFITHHNELDTDLYLRISDEMYLKRLIVGGFEKVYEITKVFRNEGVDFDHNPEFTMFEAMIAFQDYMYGMDLIEEIIEYAAMKVFETTTFKYHDQEVSVKRPWQRYKYVDAIKKFTNINVLEWKNVSDAKKQVLGLEFDRAKKKDLDKANSLGEVIAFVFEEMVEQKLIQPTMIYDYPIEISPLAKKCEDERFTQRFEMFAFGSELGNNYSELNDPIDLKARFSYEEKRKKAGIEEAHQTDEDYLEAIETGFPPTCGIAIGVDRLVMLLTDAPNIKEVIAFPTMRPLVSLRTAKTNSIKKKSPSVIPAKAGIYISKPESSKSVNKSMITREEALAFLNEKVSNKNIIKHMVAAEALMRAVAAELKTQKSPPKAGQPMAENVKSDENINEEEWGMVGLLHDGDYVEGIPANRQGVQIVEWLREKGFEVPDNVAHAMAAHNADNTGVQPQSLMDWAIFCGDSLTGLIVAAALVLPSKKLVDVTVESVLKRFKEKSFAKGTRREEIAMCQEKLGIPLEKFVEISLKAMQGIAGEIGL